MQGFYAVAFRAANLPLSPNIWEQFEMEQNMGSAGLFDPRWHPKVLTLIQDLPVGVNQASIDYFVSVQRNLYKPNCLTHLLSKTFSNAY